MKYKKLGRTKLNCSIIGFGCWGLGGIAYGPVSDKTSINALNKSLDRGINFYDTSDLYGDKDDGRSEKILGEAFKKKRNKVILATKFGLLPHNGWHMPEIYKHSHLNKALDLSLTRMKTDYIDLMQLHSPSIKTLKNKNKMNDIFEFLKKKKKEGKIRYFGISVRNPLDGLYVANNHQKFDSIQTNLNVIDQRIIENGLLDVCGKNKIGVIARTPLVYGYLTGKINEKKILSKRDHRKKWSKKQLKIWSEAPKIFKSIIKSKKQTTAQFCLQFCSSFKSVTTTIPGMINNNQVIENSNAVKFGYLNEKKKKEIYNLYKSHTWINLSNKKNV